MPSHEMHKKVSKLLLGEDHRDVHSWMDEPVTWLGSKHRLLRHDPVTLGIKYFNQPKKFLAGLLHIVLDCAVSEVKPHGNKRRNRRKVKKSKTC
jgi:hypothetical protein